MLVRAGEAGRRHKGLQQVESCGCWSHAAPISVGLREAGRAPLPLDLFQQHHQLSFVLCCPCPLTTAILLALGAVFVEIPVAT